MPLARLANIAKGGLDVVRVNSTEVQNNFGKYLLLAREQDIVITRNGQEVAKLSAADFRSKGGSSYVSEEALASGYGLRKATYEEFVELTKDVEDRYEYIDGEIFLQTSPKSDHQLALGELYGNFFNFFQGKKCTPMVAPYDIIMKRSDDDINVVQPDLMVICDLGEKIGADGYYQGIPTLVVEVLSESTRRNDLIKKLNLYMIGGVEEYWIIDPKSKAVTIHTFKGYEFDETISYKAPEKAASIIFSDLTVDLEKVFREP